MTTDEFEQAVHRAALSLAMDLNHTLAGFDQPGPVTMEIARDALLAAGFGSTPPQPSMADWYSQGLKLGFCSEQYCETHGCAPRHESEEDEFDTGGDPCCHSVRLGSLEDWAV